ncbi:dopamine receptor D4 related sequence [Hoplias malabaricus]|uniref:dopamine receptor D4 related sequence n=1 Tax=Hoplias malabaricus TaxID=27720 RepID=UPI00346317CA
MLTTSTTAQTAQSSMGLSQDVDYRPVSQSGGTMASNVTPGDGPEEAQEQYNYLALVGGVPLILIIILGNVLVCLSVLTERSLKTATNYFIVSLAVADLLLAVLVLPLYVYSEFLGGKWTLSMYICDALMTMDVMLCTASILNLCAISVDRYIAVVVPLKYNRNQFSVRQLALITATWVLSLGVASPVIFGLNQVPNRNSHVCKLEDNKFVVYSSVCSFFVPCPVMLLLYYWMFRGLKRWSSGRGRSRLSRASGGRRSLSLRLGAALQREKGRAREKVVYLMPGGLSPTSLSAVPTSPLSPTSPINLSPDELPEGQSPAADSDPMTTQMDSVSDAENAERATEGGSIRENGLGKHHEARRARRHSKSSRVSGRERKAMKVLPIVVGVFLACWTPFFVVHVTKALCESCDIGPTLISVVTWLGYVNSAVNPIIYTAFNAEFRNVFHKLLCCRSGD